MVISPQDICSRRSLILSADNLRGLFSSDGGDSDVEDTFAQTSPEGPSNERTPRWSKEQLKILEQSLWNRRLHFEKSADPGSDAHRSKFEQDDQTYVCDLLDRINNEEQSSEPKSLHELVEKVEEMKESEMKSAGFGSYQREQKSGIGASRWVLAELDAIIDALPNLGPRLPAHKLRLRNLLQKINKIRKGHNQDLEARTMGDLEEKIRQLEGKKYPPKPTRKRKASMSLHEPHPSKLKLSADHSYPPGNLFGGPISSERHTYSYNRKQKEIVQRYLLASGDVDARKGIIDHKMYTDFNDARSPGTDISSRKQLSARLYYERKTLKSIRHAEPSTTVDRLAKAERFAETERRGMLHCHPRARNRAPIESTMGNFDDGDEERESFKSPGYRNAPMFSPHERPRRCSPILAPRPKPPSDDYIDTPRFSPHKEHRELLPVRAPLPEPPKDDEMARLRAENNSLNDRVSALTEDLAEANKDRFESFERIRVLSQGPAWKSKANELEALLHDAECGKAKAKQETVLVTADLKKVEKERNEFVAELYRLKAELRKTKGSLYQTTARLHQANLGLNDMVSELDQSKRKLQEISEVKEMVELGAERWSQAAQAIDMIKSMVSVLSST